MPNWTFNTLRVVANKDSEEQVKQFDEFVKASIVPAKIYDKEGKVTGESKEDKAFTFEGVHPMPKELMITAGSYLSEEETKQEKINLEKHGHKNWYDWSIAEWGTKWNASAFDLCDEWEDEYEKVIMLRFDTAWSPPMGWLQKATDKFPLIRFEMDVTEESDMFIGKPIAQYGIVCENITDINYPSEVKK